MRYTKSLKGSVNFKRVLKQGRYVSHKNIAIYVKKNLDDSSNLLGICVSKKHGNSVVRNKLKRWVREGYYEIENNLLKGYNIVILFKKGIDINNINYFIIKDEIKDLFIKNELFYEENI